MQSLNPEVFAAICLALWHHQGGSSPVGQPLRPMLGLGQHDHMTPDQIEAAKRLAKAIDANQFSDWISYDTVTDVLTIHGKRYSAAMFGADGFLAPEGTLLRIERSHSETVCLSIVESDDPVAWINWSALTGERRLGWQCESEIASEPLYPRPQAVALSHLNSENGSKSSADAEIASHAKRLALELECLLLACDDMAAVSKRWKPAHDALENYQADIERLYAQPHISPLGKD